MPDSALTTGEKAIFNYVLAAFSADTENTHAFRDELPAVFDSSNTRMWTVYFEGGGTPDDVGQTPNQSCNINGTGRFDGVFTLRATAQTYACTLKTLFNTSTLTNVDHVLLTQDPIITRAVVHRDPDMATSGEVRVWRL